MVEAFTEYLQGRSVGEGAKSIYARFKKVIKTRCHVEEPLHGHNYKGG